MAFYHVPFCHYQQKKKKKKKKEKKTDEKVIVNGVLPETPTLIAQTNGHTAATTPAQSSEDSDSGKETVSLSSDFSDSSVKWFLEK
jgi:hypothetical protein